MLTQSLHMLDKIQRTREPEIAMALPNILEVELALLPKEARSRLHVFVMLNILSGWLECVQNVRQSSREFHVTHRESNRYVLRTIKQRILFTNHGRHCFCHLHSEIFAHQSMFSLYGTVRREMIARPKRIIDQMSIHFQIFKFQSAFGSQFAGILDVEHMSSPCSLRSFTPSLGLELFGHFWKRVNHDSVLNFRMSALEILLK